MTIIDFYKKAQKEMEVIFLNWATSSADKTSQALENINNVGNIDCIKGCVDSLLDKDFIWNGFVYFNYSIMEAKDKLLTTPIDEQPRKVEELSNIEKELYDIVISLEKIQAKPGNAKTELLEIIKYCNEKKIQDLKDIYSSIYASLFAEKENLEEKITSILDTLSKNTARIEKHIKDGNYEEALNLHNNVKELINKLSGEPMNSENYKCWATLQNSIIILEESLQQLEKKTESNEQLNKVKNAILEKNFNLAKKYLENMEWTEEVDRLLDLIYELEWCKGSCTTQDELRKMYEEVCEDNGFPDLADGFSTENQELIKLKEYLRKKKAGY